MYAIVVHQAVILAVVVSAGVVGGAPTGVTPTVESPPTAPASRGSSSGSYDLLEAPGAERGVGHDRENLCTNSDCADVTKSSNPAGQQQRLQRRRQVSHLYLTKEKKDDSGEVPSQSRAARDADTRVTDWLLGQSTSQAFDEGAGAGLSTWSWLNGAREATLAPAEESKKDARDGFLQYSAASSLFHNGNTAYGTAQTGGMTGSWSLPIRFSQSGTKKISNPLTSSPSLPPVPDRTTRETEPHAGHQWLTTQTVSDAPITVTDEPDSIPSHPEERPPGPQSPHATKPLVATHLNTHTNPPLLTTSPPTNTPRFTSYPRTRRPHPTASKHTHTPHPLTTQQANSPITQPTSKPQQHSFHKSREPPVNQNHDTVLQHSSTPPHPSTIEWLTFLLSDHPVSSDHAPTTESVTTADPEKTHALNTSQDAIEDVKDVPILDLESSHTLTPLMDPGHDASSVLNHGNPTVQKFPRRPDVPVRELTTELSTTTNQAHSASEHSHKYPDNPFVITVQPKVSEQTPKSNEHPHSFFDLSGRPESPPKDTKEPVYRVSDIAESTEKLHDNAYEMFIQPESTTDSEMPMSNHEQRVNATEQPPTSPKHIQTDPVNHFTGTDNANTPRYKISTANNQKLKYEGQSFAAAGESSFGNLHYMHKLPHQSYTDPEYEGPSSDLTQIREILGQLLEVPEQPVERLGNYPPVQSSTDYDRLITFTSNILEQTTASTDTLQTGYQTTENSPWTALLPTSSSPKNGLLSKILSQTLTFLSYTNPLPNTNNTGEKLSNPFPNRTNSEKVPDQTTISLIPQDTSSILALKNQTPNYNSGETQGTPVLSAPPDTISLLSALTTTSPIKSTPASEQSISCEDVGKLSPLLDFYGSVYPGLTNPCKSLRADKESEGIVNNSDLYSTHEQKEKPVSSENIGPVPSDFSPVTISDIPIGYSTYRIPDPNIVSNSYSTGSSHVSHSHISIDQPIVMIRSNYSSQSTSDSTQPPTGMIPSPTDETPTIYLTTSIPYSVHFPKRNVSWHISAQPHNISTAKYEPSPTLSPPPMYEDTHNTSSISEDNHSPSPTLPSFTSDEIPQPEAYLTFEDFDDKPTATLVAGDGSSIVVSSTSLNVGHALPEPYKEGEDTKWVKISVEPSVYLAPTPSSASTSKELPSTSTLPSSSTEKEGNSSIPITSIWGSWYKRWSSSRSKVTSGDPASDTGVPATTTENQIVGSSFTAIPSAAPTTTTLALANHTIYLLLDSLETHPSTTDPAESYLLSESQATKIPSVISQAVPTPMVLPTTPPTSTFHATSQTTPLSAKPAASPAISFTSPFLLSTNNKSPARNLTISSLQTESPLNKSGPAKLTVGEDSVTPLTTLMSTENPIKHSDNNSLILTDGLPHTQPLTEGHTTPLSAESETESPVNESTETTVSNSSSQNSTIKELISTSLGTTSSPLTRVLGSLWDLFRPQKPKLKVQTEPVAPDDHKNESHSGNDVIGNTEQSVTTTKIPLYTIYNLTSAVPSAVTKSMPSNVTAITQNTDNSTVLMSDTNHEEKHRFLQMFSTRREPQVIINNPSEGNVERVRPSPTKSPLASYLPSSIESLENLFTLLGKFGNKHSIFGGHEKRRNEQGEETVPGNHWPLVLRQRPSQPPHFPQLVAPPVTVTYRPPPAHHRPGAGISTQRPAIILKKQGSRVHIPLIPSADFSSFQPHSSIRSKITSNLFDPRPETTVNPAIPPRATGTLPLNIIRSRVGETEYDRTNDVRNVEAEVDERQRQRPPSPAEPKTSETHQRRRCGSRLLDRLDYLLGRELVMDQFGVRVYSSVVERWALTLGQTC